MRYACTSMEQKMIHVPLALLSLQKQEQWQKRKRGQKHSFYLAISDTICLFSFVSMLTQGLQSKFLIGAGSSWKARANERRREFP